VAVAVLSLLIQIKMAVMADRVEELVLEELWERRVARLKMLTAVKVLVQTVVTHPGPESQNTVAVAVALEQLEATPVR
jgi:hypothetical protein